MKLTMAFATAVCAFLIAAQPANAWRLEGCARCAGGAGDPVIGAQVIVEDEQGNIVGSALTAAPYGCFRVELPDTPADYKAYINPASVPAGTTILMPLGGTHYFGLSQEKDWEIVTFKTDGPDCAACWLTGGGVKFDSVLSSMAGEAGPRDSFGGNVFPSCSSKPGNGGNVNVVLHAKKLHLKNTDIDSVRCGNVPGIEPGSESPVTPFNFLEWTGTGTIVGIKGNKAPETPVYVFGRAEDRNEPGNQNAASGEDVDRLFIRVFTDPGDPIGSTILTVDEDGIADATVDPLLITGGNLQIHASSCDDPPPAFPLF